MPSSLRATTVWAILSPMVGTPRTLTPSPCDFGIRTASIPKVSYIDVLRGDEATLAKLRNKKVIIDGTALELGDRFSTPNGGVVSGPLLQALAAESIFQERTLTLAVSLGAIGASLCLRHLRDRRPWPPRVSMPTRGVSSVSQYAPSCMEHQPSG